MIIDIASSIDKEYKIVVRPIVKVYGVIFVRGN
jgi:hypothetical protein